MKFMVNPAVRPLTPADIATAGSTKKAATHKKIQSMMETARGLIEKHMDNATVRTSLHAFDIRCVHFGFGRGGSAEFKTLEAIGGALVEEGQWSQLNVIAPPTWVLPDAARDRRPADPSRRGIDALTTAGPSFAAVKAALSDKQCEVGSECVMRDPQAATGPYRVTAIDGGMVMLEACGVDMKQYKKGQLKMKVKTSEVMDTFKDFRGGSSVPKAVQEWSPVFLKNKVCIKDLVAAQIKLALHHVHTSRARSYRTDLRLVTEPARCKGVWAQKDINSLELVPVTTAVCVLPRTSTRRDGGTVRLGDMVDVGDETYAAYLQIANKATGPVHDRFYAPFWFVTETQFAEEANMKFATVEFVASPSSAHKSTDWAGGTYIIPTMVNTRPLTVGEQLKFLPYSSRDKYPLDDEPPAKRRRA